MFLCALFLAIHPAMAADPELPEDPFVEVLGIAQDAGHPQAGCKKTCCAGAWSDAHLGHRVVSLAILDPASGERWFLDASPDFPAQLKHLDDLMPANEGHGISGIFLTHAHIGHYTGLMHLGREAMGAKNIPVYAMPKMRRFLEESGPWELLVRLNNIALRDLQANETLPLNSRIRIQPLQVPHRGEYTETVGFVVSGPNRSVLYLPDMDKWERWETSIETLIASVDRAYLDGTFFAAGETPGRSMEEIPHPFVQESMQRFSHLPASERNKIHFLHFNHTNPLLRANSPEAAALSAAGMHAAQRGDRLGL
jgi:pyrroloquinoline quinone biosynthesis protein B